MLAIETTLECLAHFDASADDHRESGCRRRIGEGLAELAYLPI
jgi:hypothetical protein